MPAIRYDGVDDHLSSVSMTTFGSKRGGYFTAIKILATSAGSARLATTFGAAVAWVFYHTTGDSEDPYSYYDGISYALEGAGGADPDIAWALLSMTRDTNTALGFRRNEVAKTGATIADVQPSASVVTFADEPGGGVPSNHDEADTVLTSGAAPTAAQVLAIEAFINGRYPHA